MKKFFSSNKDKKSRDAVVELNSSPAADLAPGLQNLYSPQMSVKSHVRDIADVLVEMNKISAEQAGLFHKELETKSGTDIEQLLVKAKVDAEDILAAKAQLFGFEFRRITPEMVDREVFEKLELKYIKNNHIVPVAIKNGVLEVTFKRLESSSRNSIFLDSSLRWNDRSLHEC